MWIIYANLALAALGVLLLLIGDQAMPDDDQPHVDHWPMWDEPLSKITAPPAPIDIEEARRRLSERFNRRKNHP